MNNRRKAITALAVGTMLVGATGTTMAVWHASESVSLAGNQTGQFALAHSAQSRSSGQPVWNWSITRGGQTVAGVAPGASLTTPVQSGDVITATTYVDAKLAGTNLVARLVPTGTNNLAPRVSSSPSTGWATAAPVTPWENLTQPTRDAITNAYNSINPENWHPTVTVGNQSELRLGATTTTTHADIPVTVRMVVPNLPALPLEFRGSLQQDVDFGSFNLLLEQVRTPGQ